MSTGSRAPEDDAGVVAVETTAATISVHGADFSVADVAVAVASDA